MCLSRLQRVLSVPSPGRAEVEDMTGHLHVVSLLALDGPTPRPGDWVIVHSGYAIGRADADEAEQVRSELSGVE